MVSQLSAKQTANKVTARSHKQSQKGTAIMTTTTIVPLRDHAVFLETAAQWFSQKWDIPVQAYQESIQQCMQNTAPIPQWYLVLNQQQQIVAGAGIIDNDFHDRKDLSPNLCALFVEEPYRKQGIARQLLQFITQDMAQQGIDKLYLVTDHTAFYERCGWSFFTMVQGDDGCQQRMYLFQA